MYVLSTSLTESLVNSIRCGDLDRLGRKHLRWGERVEDGIRTYKYIPGWVLGIAFFVVDNISFNMIMRAANR
jgi:hypothetical protein